MECAVSEENVYLEFHKNWRAAYVIRDGKHFEVPMEQALDAFQRYASSQKGAILVGCTLKLAAGEGIEPPKTDSKSVVFPLNEPAS